MANLNITGADILGVDGLHQDGIGIAEGRVAEQPAGKSIDLTGYMVLPGIVDVHGDGFERHLAPRRGAMKQMAEGLVATEAELAANGITTAVLAQFVSWEGGVRGPEYAEQVFSAIRDTKSSLVTDLHAQLRLETHLLDLYENLPYQLESWGIDYVVFNDHLPHKRLSEGKHPPRMVGQALKAQRNPDVHFQMLKDLHAASPQVPAALDALCEKLVARGARFGSHDDATAAGQQRWHQRGAQVAEFPETLEAAEAAKELGHLVVLGSPNVVRGGSHKGNASALELVAMGLCDALASDYHYPSPRRAALLLARSGVLPIQDAWALVSEGPAKVLGLRDRGRLIPGKRADIVILDKATERVAATMAGGTFSYMSGAIAQRFFG